jgi:hypothetical protein
MRPICRLGFESRRQPDSAPRRPAAARSIAKGGGQAPAMQVSKEPATQRSIQPGRAD